jgi:UDP-N-acetyl-D-mannosaminuronic acid dehydrogenase
MVKILLNISRENEILESEYTIDLLIRKINEKKSTICVVGLGQVGLPTALSFLKSNYNVVGYDVNENLVRNLVEGITHITEKGFKELIAKFIQNKSFTVATSANVLLDSDVVIICVATPLNDTGFRADMTFLKKAIEDVAKCLTKEKLIVIESTIPPTTMKEFVIPMIEQLSEKKAGIDFLISFCPERIAPGNALQEYINNARIIGANDEASYLATLSLFKNITKGSIYRADTTTAEISKLAENSYRDINIAFANELAIICEQSNADVMDVISLANTHPRVNIHKPGPGVGGPCLPKDPYLLITGKQFEQSIVKIARSINDSMPTHVVENLVRNIDSNKKRKNLNIVVLGVSYKADVNDTRHSPTEGIILALRKEGFVNIVVHDPYSNESFGANFSADLHSVLREADCVIIATGHFIYSSLSTNDFKKGCIVMDAVRLLNKRNFVNSEVYYISIGD